MERIIEALTNSIETKQKILNNQALLQRIHQVIKVLITAYKNNQKVLFCGNGGSAADAQHLAAELSGKFYIDRDPLFAEALHVNTSYLTAIANDYSFAETYARLTRAFGTRGDILIALSTSGNSTNIINAIEAANEIGMLTVGLTGETGGKMKNLCDFLINIPSLDTPRIQESHITVGHIICESVEHEIFGRRNQ